MRRPVLPLSTWHMCGCADGTYPSYSSSSQQSGPVLRQSLQDLVQLKPGHPTKLVVSEFRKQISYTLQQTLGGKMSRYILIYPIQTTVCCVDLGTALKKSLELFEKMLFLPTT